MSKKTHKFHRMGYKRAISIVLDEIESFEDGEWVDLNSPDGTVYTCTVLTLRSGKVYNVWEPIEFIEGLLKEIDNAR